MQSENLPGLSKACPKLFGRCETAFEVYEESAHAFNRVPASANTNSIQHKRGGKPKKKYESLISPAVVELSASQVSRALSSQCYHFHHTVLQLLQAASKSANGSLPFPGAGRQRQKNNGEPSTRTVHETRRSAWAVLLWHWSDPCHSFPVTWKLWFWLGLFSYE